MSSDLIPSDDTLLEEIITAQNTEGTEVGLHKIYDHIKAEHPLWTFSLKRLRNIRKNHNLAPSPPTAETQSMQQPTTTSNSSSNAADDRTRASTSSAPHSNGSDSLQLRLTFDVMSGRDIRVYTFEKPIPRIFCETNFQRSALPFVNRLINACEKEIVASQARRCVHCQRPATHVYLTPFINLNARPPTVQAHGQPVCAMMSFCHGLIYTASVDSLNGLRAGGMLPQSTMPSEDWFVLYPSDCQPA